MPRRKPLTPRQIEGRQELGFGPRAAPKNTPAQQDILDAKRVFGLSDWRAGQGYSSNRTGGSPASGSRTRPHASAHGTVKHTSPKCKNNDHNFDEALEWLGLADVSAERKRDYERQLNEIIRAHRLALRVEDEESPAGKAEAFHGAIRSCERLGHIVDRIADTSLSEKYSKRELERYREEARLLQRLPPALADELMRRQQLSNGHSLADCCRELRDHYRSESKPGRNKTYALRNTVHRLQAFASSIDKELNWMSRRQASGPKRRAKATGRNVPGDLIRFVISVLDAAGIEHPSSEGSPSKFRRLMVGHRPRPPQ
jgi:hypothetical protein